MAGGGRGGGGGGGGGGQLPSQLAIKRGRQNDDRGAPAAKQITRNVFNYLCSIVIMLGKSSSIAKVGDRRKEGGISPHVIYIYSICYVIERLRR